MQPLIELGQAYSGFRVARGEHISSPLGILAFL